MGTYLGWRPLNNSNEERLSEIKEKLANRKAEMARGWRQFGASYTKKSYFKQIIFDAENLAEELDRITGETFVDIKGILHWKGCRLIYEEFMPEITQNIFKNYHHYLETYCECLPHKELFEFFIKCHEDKSSPYYSIFEDTLGDLGIWHKEWREKTIIDIFRYLVDNWDKLVVTYW